MGIFGREMGGGRLPVTVYAVPEGISVGALGYRPFSLVFVRIKLKNLMEPATCSLKSDDLRP